MCEQRGLRCEQKYGARTSFGLARTMVDDQPQAWRSPLLYAISARASGDFSFKLFALISLKSAKCFSPAASMFFSSSEYSPEWSWIMATLSFLTPLSISRLLSNRILIVDRYMS